MEPNTEIATYSNPEVFPAKESNIPDDLAHHMRVKLAGVVEKDFSQIVQAQADLAKGLWIKEWVKDKEGKIIERRVYQQKPDKDSGQYLLNQIIGKPKENMVVAGKVNFILDS